MKSTKHFTKHQKVTAIEMVVDGISVSKVSRMYGCDRKTLEYWLKEYRGVIEGELITLESKV